VAARGAWMGNRGVLHDAEKRVVAPWRLRRWITCALVYKDRRRGVFSPRRYSELFFLDEATSLSAGHRPCAECQRGRYEEFRSAWAAGRGLDARPSADAMDMVLHAERVERGHGKRTYEAVLSTLPEGTIVDYEGQPHLSWRGTLRLWTFSGYGPPADAPSGARVAVLTPESVVEAIRHGFAPQVHPSAGPPS
jgi:hypothetical protein